MTDPNGTGPVEYSSKLGGGRSARLIALAVVVVLGGFIGVGILGREPGPPPQVADVPATAAPPSESASSAPPPSPSPTDPQASIVAIPPSSETPDIDDQLAAVLEVAGTAYSAHLEVTGPDQWHVAYRIPFPRPALEATLILTQGTASAEGAERISLGRWPISLEPMTPEWAQSETVLDVVEPPRDETAVHEVGRSGYRIVALAASHLYFGVLTVDVRRAPNPEPNESYAVDVRLGDFATRVPLSALRPGHLTGTLIIPDSVTADRLDLSLVAMPASNPMLGMVTVYEFTLEMPPHGDFAGSGVGQTAGPEEPRPGAPELLTFGHEFQAQTSYWGFLRAVVFGLRINGGFDSSAGDGLASSTNDGGFADMSMPFPPRDYGGPFER